MKSTPWLGQSHSMHHRCPCFLFLTDHRLWLLRTDPKSVWNVWHRTCTPACVQFSFKRRLRVGCHASTLKLSRTLLWDSPVRKKGQLPSSDLSQCSSQVGSFKNTRWDDMSMSVPIPKCRKAPNDLTDTACLPGSNPWGELVLMGVLEWKVLDVPIGRQEQFYQCPWWKLGKMGPKRIMFDDCSL